MTEAQSPRAVLDTNVWLDWLVFDDASVAPLKRAQLSLITCRSARAELADVLGRVQFGLNADARRRILVAFDGLVSLMELPPVSTTRLRCTDRDDQQFLELAVATRAHYLLTRDKALLRLARRAGRDHQLLILTPDQWQQRIGVARSPIP